MASSLSVNTSKIGVGNQMALADLREGSTGPITVMVCRKWDVTSVNGRYMSTDYVVSDIKGGVMHCTARNNIAHYFYDKLKEGGIYLLKGFTVQRTDQYRILKDNPFVIGLNGSTTVKRVDDTSGSFTRYPFLLTAFEDLEPTEGKYLVDVIGYVTEVGPPSVKSSGARAVEFNLTNERNRRVRVTLWGHLGDAMIKKKDENPTVYSLILTSMSAKFYLGVLGLSSSSSTMLIDSSEVPALQTFKSSISCVAIGDTSAPVTEDVVSVGTLQELVDRVRADKSKKKLPVRPFMMLEASFAFHTHSRVMPNGLTQYVCGLKLLDQAGTNKDEGCRLWPAAPGVVSNSIQAHRCSHTLSDGKIQTYFGLTLINSCSDATIVGSKHSIRIQSRDYVGLGGKTVTYCGPTLSNINASASSDVPNAGDTQIQPPAVTVATGPTARVGTGKSIKGKNIMQSDAVQMQPVLCPPTTYSPSVSAQDNISCTPQNSHQNVAGPSRLRPSRPKKTEGVRIRTPRRAAFASTDNSYIRATLSIIRVPSDNQLST
ncbi:putative nucleic acid-binding protein [Helianthus annuus]|nr:putative nucleic acid-binding protein [Helianthus annuus]